MGLKVFARAPSGSIRSPARLAKIPMEFWYECEAAGLMEGIEKCSRPHWDDGEEGGV